MPVTQKCAVPDLMSWPGRQLFKLRSRANWSRMTGRGEDKNFERVRVNQHSRQCSYTTDTCARASFCAHDGNLSGAAEGQPLRGSPSLCSVTNRLYRPLNMFPSRK